MIRRIGNALLAPVIAFVFAAGISSIVLLLAGYNPLDAFKIMWDVMDSTESIILVINRAVPYYVAGVAVGIGFKMGLFNIGVTGQYRLAALMAAAAGAAVDLWAPLHVMFILVVAVATGAAWAAIPAALKVFRGVNEVVSTIMMNYITVGILAWSLSTYFRNENVDLVAETRPLPRSAWLPELNRFFEAIGLHFGDGIVLQGFLPFAIALGVAYHLMLNRSRFGYELRATGINPWASRSSGVSPKRMVFTTFVLSGAIAGLIGMAPLLANPQFHKYGDQFPQFLGVTGIAVALLGRNSPVGIGIAALAWAGIERATQPLSLNGLPTEISYIMQGTLLLSAVIAYEVARRRNEAAAVRAAATIAHHTGIEHAVAAA